MRNLLNLQIYKNFNLYIFYIQSMNQQNRQAQKKNKSKSKKKKHPKPDLDKAWKKDPSIPMTKEQKRAKKIQKQKIKLDNRFKQRTQIKSKFWQFESDNQQAFLQMNQYYKRMECEDNQQTIDKQQTQLACTKISNQNQLPKIIDQIKIISRSRSRSKEKKKSKKQKKEKKEKKEKKNKKEKKSKKLKNTKDQQSQISSFYSSDNTSEQIFAQKVKFKNDSFIKKQEGQKIIGPILAFDSSNERKFIQKERPDERVLRKGQIGYTKEEIQQYEKMGYVMSGSRYYNPNRQKKDTNTYNNQQKRAVTLLKYQQKHIQEQRLMAEYKQKVEMKYKKKFEDQ